MSDVKKIVVLGAGGLGRTAARYLEFKHQMKLVGICDSQGVAWAPEGITYTMLNSGNEKKSVGEIAGIGEITADPIGSILSRKSEFDGVFTAIPNIPNNFVPSLIERFAEAGFDGVMVDALKRSSAMELIYEKKETIDKSQMVYVCGGGATPGLLTAVANIAAQSYTEIDSVDIYFGVGVANWDEYKGTIREDIAHLPGYSVDRVAALTDDEISRILEERNGILELVGMEHADDVILERAGVVSRECVRVGGIVDTRSPRKPVSTRMKITGKTFEGKTSSHIFTLGDDTSMAANVLGPVFGYLNAGFWLKSKGITGFFTCADIMPRFVR
ncbi:MAG: saccharopine dehydrogenase-like oxidoreductase [bacterium]